VLADSLALNGGVLHSVEVLTKSGELVAAMDGFEYYGLPKVAELLARAHGVPSSDAALVEAALNREYSQLLGDDGLMRRFKDHFEKHPDAYEPI
jgi:hypothetical protein